MRLTEATLPAALLAATATGRLGAEPVGTALSYKGTLATSRPPQTGVF
jgi:hypothetical protein